MTQIPTKEEHDRAEIARLQSQLSEVDKQRTAELKTEIAEFTVIATIDLHDVDYAGEPRCLIGERVDWLIDGNYGYGAYVEAREYIQSKLRNAPAYLFTRIAALEWGIPQRTTRAIWKDMAPGQQQALLDVLNGCIERAKEHYRECDEYNARTRAQKRKEQK